MVMNVKRRGIKYFISNFDWTMFIAMLTATAMGLALIHSAGLSGGTSSRDVAVQSIAWGIGLLTMALLCYIDYDLFERLALAIGVLGVAVLILVLLIGTGGEEVGTKGWIYLGPVSIQPSEFAKLAFIISLAAHIAKVEEHINEPKKLLFLIGHFAVYAALILCQPDYGTMMVFAFIFLGMLFMAGVRLRYFAMALGVALAAAVPAWFFVLSSFQRARILTFMNPEMSPLDEGYQVLQSMLAIGSGRITGNGYMRGNQTQMGYLPQARTDFIYAVAGEEFGFIGCVIVLLLLVFIICRCFYNAEKAKDTFGRMLCVGVGCFLLFHTVENICMCLNLLPVTGIPLPFFSSGGSNLLASYMAVGLVLNVRLRRKVYGLWL